MAPAEAPAGDGAPRDGAAAPSPAAPRSNKPLLVAGLVAALALGAGAIALASSGEQARRVDPAPPATVTPPDGTEVTLPDSVLDLPQAVGLSLTLQQALAPGLSGAFVDPQIGVYAGEPETETVTVYAGGARESDPAAGLEAFRATYDAGAETDLGEGTEVDPGELGGVARCWLTDFGEQPLGICAFVDARTVVVLVDSIETEDLDAVADRGREVREATVT